MKVIEPHIHMIARTTQDYERMARMHTVACCEPSFWAGYDRSSPEAFYDYLEQPPNPNHLSHAHPHSHGFQKPRFEKVFLPFALLMCLYALYLYLSESLFFLFRYRVQSPS